MTEDAIAQRRRLHRWLKSLSNVLGVIAIVNFIAMFVTVMIWHGGGFGTKIEDGHYFLRQGGAAFIEVSHAVYDYSWWQAHSVLVTHPLAMIVTLIYHWVDRDSRK